MRGSGRGSPEGTGTTRHKRRWAGTTHSPGRCLGSHLGNCRNLSGSTTNCPGTNDVGQQPIRKREHKVGQVSQTHRPWAGTALAPPQKGDHLPTYQNPKRMARVTHISRSRSFSQKISTHTRLWVGRDIREQTDTTRVLAGDRGREPRGWAGRGWQWPGHRDYKLPARGGGSLTPACGRREGKSTLTFGGRTFWVEVRVDSRGWKWPTCVSKGLREAGVAGAAGATGGTGEVGTEGPEEEQFLNWKLRARGAGARPVQWGQQG